MKLIIPVDVCIKRFYRTYVKVDENATNEQIRTAVKEMICEEQDAVLTPEPSLEIEDRHIEFVDVAREDAWTEEEDEEIGKILNGE